MVYLVGGLLGMRKTSRILKGMIAKKVNLVPLLTDGIRFAIRNVIIGNPPVSIGEISFKGTATFQFPKDEKGYALAISRERQGEDQLAWIGTLNLIKYYISYLQQDLLVDGVAFTPLEIRELELSIPEIKIKAAFVGCNKKAILKPGKYGSEDRYEEVERCNKFKKQVKDFKLPNYEYFDLIERIPIERSNQEIVPLEEQDFVSNAEKVIEWLLKD